MHAAIFLVLLVVCASSEQPDVVLRGRSLQAAKAKCTAAQLPGCTPAKRVARGAACVCLSCAAAKGYVAGARSPTDKKAALQCVCPPGFYEQGSSCVQCEIGSFCPGGDAAAKTVRDDRGTKTACKAGTSTAAKGSISGRDCVAKKDPASNNNQGGTSATTSSVDGSTIPVDAGDLASSPEPAPESPSPSPSPSPPPPAASPPPPPLDRALLCSGDTYAAPPTNTVQMCIKCTRGLRVPPDFTGPRTDKATVCHVPPGFYYTGISARECPQGTYRGGYGKIDDPASLQCTPCPAGSTTETFSSSDASQCKLCIDGWGKVSGDDGTSASEVCGPCNYGEWSSGGYEGSSAKSVGGDGGAIASAASADDEEPVEPPPTSAPAVAGACMLCPSTTFQHAVGNPFVSYGLTFATKNVNPESCVPRFSQLPVAAGAKLAIQDEKAFTLIEDGINLKVCVQACPVDSCCIAEFESDDGSSSTSGTCRRVVLPPLGRGDTTKPALYYKLPSSSVMSGGRRRLQSTGSGLFARCDMSQWGTLPAEGYIGVSPNPALIEAASTTVEWNAPGCIDEASCKDSCLFDAPCWGFIFVPGKGWALRGGEDSLGSRTFFAIPDPTKTPQPLDMEALKW